MSDIVCSLQQNMLAIYGNLPIMRSSLFACSVNTPLVSQMSKTVEILEGREKKEINTFHE